MPIHSHTSDVRPSRGPHARGSLSGAVREVLAGPWNRSCGAMAIDFRDGVARMLQVDQRTGAVLAAARVAHDEEHPERTAERISVAARGEGFRGDACVVGLPIDIVRAEAMCVDDGHDDAIRGAVEKMAASRFGCTSPQAGFIRLAPVDGGRVEIVAIVAERKPLERLLHSLIDWGLLPEAAEPAFLASARACSRVFRRASDRSRVRLAVDTSTRGATAMLLAGDRIVYSRSTREVSRIAETASRCLREGMAFATGGAPSEVRVVGAFAEDRQLTESLERSCSLPVRLDDERSTIGIAWRSISARVARDDRPWEWSSALGLAFRSAPRWSLRAIGEHHRREAA